MSRASEIAASLGTEVAGLLARTIGWLCEGEIEQLRHTYDIGRPEDSYLVSIQGKTASLFGTAARIGGIVAGLDRTRSTRSPAWGNAFGMVFQIVDDILDITDTTEQLGKPAGHDLVEGVYTLPVLRTLALGGGRGDELAVCSASRSTSPSGTRRWPSCGSTKACRRHATARQYVAAAEAAVRVAGCRRTPCGGSDRPPRRPSECLTPRRCRSLAPGALGAAGYDFGVSRGPAEGGGGLVGGLGRPDLVRGAAGWP